MSTADGPGYSCHRSIMVLDLRGGGRRWMTNSVGFLIVRRICLRSFLRGPMRDGQVPAVPDRHEAKAEAQNPAGQRGNAIGETEQRSEEHTAELQSLMRISSAVFCLNKKTKHTQHKLDKQQHNT